MADFGRSYAITSAHEGGYVHAPDDKGGETYMGVARKFHPNWPGWTILDFYHSNNPRLKTGEFLPAKEQSWILPMHKELFYQFWTDSRAGELADQRLAYIYYDFYIMTMSNAVRLLQSALNANGARLQVDGRIGPLTIQAANRIDAEKVHDTYKVLRAAFHKNAVAKGWVHRKFLPQWLKRNNTFPTLRQITSNSWIVLVLLFGASAAFALQGEFYNTKLNLGDYEK